jgi:hypothetical protein
MPPLLFPVPEDIQSHIDWWKQESPLLRPEVADTIARAGKPIYPGRALISLVESRTRCLALAAEILFIILHFENRPWQIPKMPSNNQIKPHSPFNLDDVTRQSGRLSNFWETRGFPSLSCGRFGFLSLQGVSLANPKARVAAIGSRPLLLYARSIKCA